MSLALGRTSSVRRLTVVFTVREERVRVISARPMSRKEKAIYERTEAKSTEAEKKD